MQTKKIRLGENFFDRLKQVIKYTGKKKSDFAKALNVSPGNLSDWLSGRSQPDGLILIRINEIFGIDLNWMMSGEGEMIAKNSATANGESNSDINRIQQLTPASISFRDVMRYIDGFLLRADEKDVDLIIQRLQIWLRANRKT